MKPSAQKIKVTLEEILLVKQVVKKYDILHNILIRRTVKFRVKNLNELHFEIKEEVRRNRLVTSCQCSCCMDDGD